MDISKFVYIWVKTKEPSDNGMLLDGLAFDGEYGFGHEEVRNFKGKLAVLSRSCRSEIDVNLSTAHESGKGVLWYIDTDNLPSTPFLITSNLELQGLLTVSIALQPTRETIEIFNRDGATSYPVSSSKFIGVLQHENNSDTLIAFADTKYLITNEIELTFCEWDSLVGKLQTL